MDNITHSDPLVTFFYYLMMDELPYRSVTRLVQVGFDIQPELAFDNQLIAECAKEFADALRNAKSEDLLEDAVKNKKMEERDMKELEEQIISMNVVKTTSSTIDDAKQTIEQLLQHGGLSREDAERIEQELEDMKMEARGEEHAYDIPIIIDDKIEEEK